jgi:hypothetical protein
MWKGRNRRRYRASGWCRSRAFPYPKLGSVVLRWAVAAAVFDVGPGHPAPEAGVADPEIASDVRDRLGPLTSKLHGTPAELRRMGTRHTNSFPRWCYHLSARPQDRGMLKLTQGTARATRSPRRSRPHPSPPANRRQVARTDRVLKRLGAGRADPPVGGDACGYRDRKVCGASFHRAASKSVKRHPGSSWSSSPAGSKHMPRGAVCASQRARGLQGLASSTD